jgi:putative NADH-flavin reductase
MRLFVLGGTGRTGRALITQGLARGHEITAFGRSAFEGRSKLLRIVVGNPMQANALVEELPGNDVVLSAMGTRGLGVTSVLADSVRATIDAMRIVGLRRLVILSSSLLDSNIGRLPRFLGNTLLRHHVHDQVAMEKQVTESDLDWTVLRASRFHNGAFTGRYIVNAQSQQTKSSGVPISRENVACMMLSTAKRGDRVKQIVRICGERL